MALPVQKKGRTVADMKKRDKETYSDVFVGCLQPLLNPFLRKLFGKKPVFPNARTSNGWGPYDEDIDKFTLLTITQPFTNATEVYDMTPSVRKLATRILPGTQNTPLAFDISTLSERAFCRLFEVSNFMAPMHEKSYNRVFCAMFAVYCVWRHALADSLNFSSMAKAMNEDNVTIFFELVDPTTGAYIGAIQRINTTSTGKLTYGFDCPTRCMHVYRMLDCLYISSEALLGTRFPTDIEDIVLSYICGIDTISRTMKLVDSKRTRNTRCI
jgi:hypothetical protein